MLACPSSPCLNGATCFERFNSGGYLCACPPGFEGDMCEIDTDECGSDPCLNGATCVDSVDGYECQCPPGYEGTNCEIGECPQIELYPASRMDATSLYIVCKQD